MSNSIVAYKTFCRILSVRLKGKYSPEVIQKVIDAYTSHAATITGNLERHNEFKEDYFGGFRYSDKGWQSLGDMMAEKMTEKLEISKLSHELQRRKKEAEKRNKLVWETMNQIEGFKFKRADLKEKLGKKTKRHAARMKYTNAMLRKQLRTNKKLRKL
jgi:hypothetical protein